MSHASDVRVTSAPPAPAPARRFLLRVCTNNPFYVLSAGLFLVGLRLSFGSQAEAVHTWSLMGSLSGYTLLLAATASLLVRFGNVWDDVRTVLLLVVLMFLATSVTFDEVLFLDPVRGYTCCLGGLVLAVAVSEGLLHGIRLRLPALFRVPYYLALALFFLYPLGLSGLLGWPRGETLQWGLYGFSAAAGAVTLTLLPAVRRGPAYTADNGSPWPWPLYPWTLFGLLGAAVPARAYLLCVSMDPLVGDDRDRLIFGPYFLAPFGLAVAVVLLELGLVSSRRGAVKTALSAPVLLVWLTMVGHRSDPIYQGFRETFAARLGGDPLTLTLLGCAAFYGYAALRRVRRAADLLTAALVALALVGPQTMDRHILGPAQPFPLLAAGALQLALGLWRRDVARCLLGTVGVAAGAALSLPGDGGASSLRWLVAYHLEVAGLLTLGAVFTDRLGRALRAAGGALALAACLAATFGRFDVPPEVPPWAVAAYPLAVAAVLAGYGLLWDRRLVAAGALAGVGWLAGFGWRGYVALREVVSGLDHIALSLALFAVAVLVSLGKAGVLSRWLEARGWRPPADDPSRLQIVGAADPVPPAPAGGGETFSASP